MGPTRRVRRWLSGGLVLLLLTLQWAVAAHACARVVAEPVAVERALPCCDEDAAPCGDGEAVHALCRAHCDGPAPSVQSAGVALDVPALVDAGAARPAAVEPPAGLAAPSAAAVAVAAPDGEPPRYLLLRVLRR